jgi:hypothetical protein
MCLGAELFDKFRPKRRSDVANEAVEERSAYRLERCLDQEIVIDGEDLERMPIRDPSRPDREPSESLLVSLLSIKSRDDRPRDGTVEAQSRVPRQPFELAPVSEE